MEQVLIRLQMIINRYVKVKEGRSTAENGGAFFYNLGPGVKHRDDKGRV